MVGIRAVELSGEWVRISHDGDGEEVWREWDGEDEDG